MTKIEASAKRKMLQVSATEPLLDGDIRTLLLAASRVPDLEQRIKELEEQLKPICDCKLYEHCPICDPESFRGQPKGGDVQMNEVRKECHKVHLEPRCPKPVLEEWNGCNDPQMKLAIIP